MQLADCLFCKMVSGIIPVQKVFEDDRFICIEDIQPQAKVHLLLIPKSHIATLAAAFPQGKELTSEDLSGNKESDHVLLLGKMMEASVAIAQRKGLLPGGFRTVINVEKGAGQTVFHLHMHLLGGEVLNGSFA